MAQTARSEGIGIEGGDGEVGQGWLEKGGNRRQNVLCYRLSVPLELFQLYGSSLKTGPFRGRFGKKVLRDRVIFRRPFCRAGGVFSAGASGNDSVSFIIVPGLILHMSRDFSPPNFPPP
jgi:hypothetical protein